MAVLKFPPVETADENGLLALGGDLEVQTLILAYRQGIFPWPISEEFPLAWFSPDPRGVIEFQDLNLSKRLRRYLKKTELYFTTNQAFSRVIEECALAKRKDQSGTWITDEVMDSYREMYDRSLAYSVEAWNGEELVGGIYGVSINGILTGESMFHKVPNASKFCLIILLKILNDAGIPWLDTQMVTPIIKSLGGKEIPRKEFLNRLVQSKIKTRDEIFPSQLKTNYWREF